MQTHFTDQQLADQHIKQANDILRKCVHCGFCTATCPTYVLLGDELDSPRGRIYQIKDMLEGGKPASSSLVKHVDRCLTCLSCMTTCPSGVDYMHLVDHARVHIEKTYNRPLPEKMLRALLAFVIPNPTVFRLALIGAKFGKVFKGLMPGRLKGMMDMAPAKILPKSPMDQPQVFPADKKAVKRVALMTGCAQQVLRPSINEATVRLLTRLGVEVVVADSGCCGALVHHMGKEGEAHQAARHNVDAWMKEIDGKGLDAIVINASGCGTTVKDYGHMLAGDGVYAGKAERVSALAKDITEVLAELDLAQATQADKLTIAYHSACSMQHGQKITALPKDLLKAAGFEVKDVPEGHLCCGSAGTYNMMQPDLSKQLLDRKVSNIRKTSPDVIATGNIGCLEQISGGIDVPVVHTVELLDWATGGPKPPGL